MARKRKVLRRSGNTTDRPLRMMIWPGDTIVIHRNRRLKLEARAVGREGDVLICQKDNGDTVRVLLPGPSQMGS